MRWRWQQPLTLAVVSAGLASACQSAQAGNSDRPLPAGDALASLKQFPAQGHLRRLARLKLEIRIAHFPPYCSKHNPIEYRVFPHVTRACEGVVFESVPLVKQLIERTQTRTGLQVTVDIIDRVYETGRKAALDLKASLRIVADALLPPWNYTILPNSTA